MASIESAPLARLLLAKESRLGLGVKQPPEANFLNLEGV